MAGITFVTCVFGKSFLDFIPTCVYSFLSNHPNDLMILFYQDIPNTDKILHYSNLYPRCVFVPANINFLKRGLWAIDHRNFFWREALEIAPTTNLAFVDIDTICVGNICKFYEEDFDLAFTYSEHKTFGLNAGVILGKNSHALQHFFLKWEDSIRLLDHSRARSDYDYLRSGSIDQAAMAKIVGYENLCLGSSTIKLEGVDIKLLGISCRELNETECVPITPAVHIIHYKGGWHSILLRKAPFTKKRPMELCGEMYDYFLKIEALAMKGVQ